MFSRGLKRTFFILTIFSFGFFIGIQGVLAQDQVLVQNQRVAEFDPEIVHEIDKIP